MNHRSLMIICQWILVLPAHLFCQIVLSEIMFNPSGNERHNEYIEFYNQSTDSIDLCGWFLSDGDGECMITDAGEGCLLAPSQYAVVMLPDYMTNSTEYEHLIPNTCLMLTIDQSTFGKNGLANSRNETVSLLTPDKKTVCGYTYQTPNPDGFSEEKIVLSGSDSPENWGNGLTRKGTPGYQNSLSPPKDSLTLSLRTENMRLGEQSTINVIIENSGTNRINGVMIQAGIDRNFDSHLDTSEILVDTLALLNLSFRDSTSIHCSVSPALSGKQTILVLLETNQNQYLISQQTYIGLPFEVVTINEIFSDENGPVWIELLNQQTDTLICQNIKIFNNDQVFDLRGIQLPPGYSVIARDSVDLSPWNCNIGLWKKETGPSISEKSFLIRDKNQIIDSVRIPSFCDSKSLEKRDSGFAKTLSKDWQCCMHPLGATPGVQNSTSETFSDVLFAPETWTFSQHEINSDKIVITGSIKNVGNTPATISDMEIFIPIKNEKWAKSINTQLRGHETLSIDLEIELVPGAYEILLHCQTASETYPQNNKLILPIIKPFPKGCLVINEIKPFTDSGDQEWIEVYNPSDFTISLWNWQLCDSRRCIELSDSSATIHPNSYWVLTNDQIPKIDSCSTILNLPELNNTGDDIVLKDPFGITIDSLRYNSEWLGLRNISLERISWKEPSDDRSNWALSMDSMGTPGSYNQASPKDWDLGVTDSLQFIPQNPQAGETVKVTLSIENFGLYPTSVSAVNVIAVPVWDTLNTINLGTHTIQTLDPKEKTDITINWNNVPGGIYKIIAHISDKNDQRTENNKLIGGFKIGYPAEIVVINEVMNNPAKSEPEWFELYNVSDKEILLTDWSVCDADTATKYMITDSIFILPARSYCVISEKKLDGKDVQYQILAEKFPALNAADSLILFDATGRQIDLAVFASDFRGNSIERISQNVSGSDSTNWAICTALTGHTAAQKNSVFIPPPNQKTVLQVSPNPFSPDGDGFEDHTSIRIELPATTSRANVKLYDIKGRFIRQLVNNKVISCESTFIWDGRSETGQDCRMGIYIVVLEAIDEQKATIMQKKTTLVLAKPL